MVYKREYSLFKSFLQRIQVPRVNSTDRIRVPLHAFSINKSKRLAAGPGILYRSHSSRRQWVKLKHGTRLWKSPSATPPTVSSKNPHNTVSAHLVEFGFRTNVRRAVVVSPSLAVAVRLVLHHAILLRASPAAAARRRRVHPSLNTRDLNNYCRRFNANKQLIKKQNLQKNCLPADTECYNS